VQKKKKSSETQPKVDAVKDPEKGSLPVERRDQMAPRQLSGPLSTTNYN